MKSAYTALGWLTIAAALPVGAYAQDAGDRVRSLELFRQSEESYRNGLFDDAADKLREAYRLYPEPVLVYNLGRALEAQGELEQAADALSRYLELDPETNRREAVESRLRSIRRQLEERQTLEQERAELREQLHDRTPDNDGSQPATPTAPSAAAPLAWPWVIVGTGAAAVVVGSVFGAMAQSRHDEARIEAVHQTAADLLDQAFELETLANVFIIAGAAVSAAGLAWGILDLTLGQGVEEGVEGEEDAEVAVGLAPGGLVVFGAF